MKLQSTYIFYAPPRPRLLQGTKGLTGCIADRETAFIGQWEALLIAHDLAMAMTLGEAHFASQL